MRARRRGFSLLEILVAMTLTLTVFAITLPFVRSQSRALGASAGRLDAEQVARYAQRAIDNELRLAAGVGDQPTLVHLNRLAISFNANLMATDSTDAAALSVDAAAPTTLSDSWRVANAAALPTTARTYPTQDYTDPLGGVSGVETISYFLLPDTVSGRSDIYVLYRRVNARDSVQVVRGIHVPADSAFFTAWRDSAGVAVPIPAASLPLFWDGALAPQVTAVGIRAAGFFRNRQDGTDVIRTVHWRTSLRNGRTAAAGAACDSAPAEPADVDVDVETSGSTYYAEIDWEASSDDATGGDVTHYVVVVRPNGSPVRWQQVAVVPARRAATYRFNQHRPGLLGNVRYGVLAVGCGGVGSGVRQSGGVNLP